MDNQKCMCYVTYAYEVDSPPEFLKIGNMPVNSVKEEVTPALPPSFVLDWFKAGKFPEDEDE